MLALARVTGETAPLLILVGYSQAMNFDMFNGVHGFAAGMMYDQTSAGAGVNPIADRTDVGSCADVDHC